MYTERIEPPKGTLHIIAKDKRGAVLWEETDKNLVVNDGREQLLHMLFGDTPVVRAITDVSVGTNSTPAAVTDTAITGAFTKAITSVAYPTPLRAVVTFVIDDTEANGMSIVEFGLQHDNGKLFNRLVRLPIAKTGAIELHCTWTFDF